MYKSSVCAEGPLGPPHSLGGNMKKFVEVVVGALTPVAKQAGQQFVAGIAMAAGSMATKRAVEKWVDPMFEEKKPEVE